MNILVAILRFQGPPFTYRYGFSFLLYVSGFITTEVAGTYAIFLYISWHQKELVRRDSRRKNYGVGSISFFYTTTFGSLDRINIRLKKFFVTQIGTISPALAEYQNIGAILVKILLVAFELELLNFCFTRNNVNRLRGKLRITQKIIFSDFEKSNL